MEENTLDYWIDKASELDGDFCEIGCGRGETTLQLLTVARRCDKMVLAIDPFESEWENMPHSYASPYPYNEFLEHTWTLRDSLNLLKANSLSLEAERFLSVPLSLAFVDGLQYKGAVLSDLRIVSHSAIIIVDDFNRSSSISQVPEAIEEYLKTNKRELIVCQDRYAILLKP